MRLKDALPSHANSTILSAIGAIYMLFEALETPQALVETSDEHRKGLLRKLRPLPEHVNELLNLEVDGPIETPEAEVLKGVAATLQGWLKLSKQGLTVPECATGEYEDLILLTVFLADYFELRAGRADRSNGVH